MRLSNALPEALLPWFARNARVLPWRKNRNPYRVWISEIMLQQTRVEAAIGYYERFLAELPDVKSLAEVSDDRLMKLWQGLGYYSRARNLKTAAKEIVSRFGGTFPSDAETLRTLPGIGAYTAGAIASIAFDRPEPAVDGNVLRVIARLTECREDVSKECVRKEFAEALRAVYPAGSCGAFTQSLMELGAMVCLPNGAPLCGECPLAEQCLARAHGTSAGLPVKPEKKARRTEEKTVLVLSCRGKFALKKRPAKGLLAGLYEFPNLEGFHTAAELRNAHPDWRMEGAPVSAVHIFTHVEWHMRGWRIECPVELPEFVWAAPAELETVYSIPSAFRAFRGLAVPAEQRDSLF